MREAVCLYCQHVPLAALRPGAELPQRCHQGGVVTAADAQGRGRYCGGYEREPGADDE